MFIRKKKNKSRSTSIQVIDKSSGGYTVLKTIACATNDTKQEQELVVQAQEFISVLTRQGHLDFSFTEDNFFLRQLQDGIKKVVRYWPGIDIGKNL